MRAKPARYFSTDWAGKPLPSQLGVQAIDSGKPPLYMQYYGHSVTVVGMERRRLSASSKEDLFLLVLDPAKSTRALLEALGDQKGWQRLFKLGVRA